MFVLILPQAKPVGWSNPLKNPLRPLSEVAYSVQAFDWSGQVRPESCQVVVCLLSKESELNFTPALALHFVAETPAKRGIKREGRNSSGAATPFFSFSVFGGGGGGGGEKGDTAEAARPLTRPPPPGHVSQTATAPFWTAPDTGGTGRGRGARE